MTMEERFAVQDLSPEERLQAYDECVIICARDCFMNETGFIIKSAYRYGAPVIRMGTQGAIDVSMSMDCYDRDFDVYRRVDCVVHLFYFKFRSLDFSRNVLLDGGDGRDE